MSDRPRPYRALRHRDFARLVASQLLSVTGSQMQVVAINWQVYRLTHSPLALGFVGLTRVLPIIVFSLWAGVVADRHDRRRVMIVTQLTMTVVALALAAVTFTNRATLWLIYALNAFSAAAGTFDGPSRQALIPRLVPTEDLPGALSLNFSAFQMSTIAGPALAGAVIAAAPAVGALVGSLYLSWRPLPDRQGRVFLWAVGAYGAATVVFGLSRVFWLTLLGLAGTGLADAISTVIRQTLRQLATPDALRGRMTSVNMIFFMGGPQLGELEAGFVASLFASAALGVTVSVVSGGLATILITAAITARAPVLRRYDFREHLGQTQRERNVNAT